MVVVVLNSVPTSRSTRSGLISLEVQWRFSAKRDKSEWKPKINCLQTAFIILVQNALNNLFCKMVIVVQNIVPTSRSTRSALISLEVQRSETSLTYSIVCKQPLIFHRIFANIQIDTQLGSSCLRFSGSSQRSKTSLIESQNSIVCKHALIFYRIFANRH